MRPQFRSRLAGTLADVIARAEQTAGLGGKAKKENSAGRSAEIVELLTYAFEVRVPYLYHSLLSLESFPTVENPYPWPRASSSHPWKTAFVHVRGEDCCGLQQSAVSTLIAERSLPYLWVSVSLYAAIEQALNRTKLKLLPPGATRGVKSLSLAAQASKETGDGSLRARESWRLGAALAEAEDFEAAHALFQVRTLSSQSHTVSRMQSTHL